MIYGWETGSIDIEALNVKADSVTWVILELDWSRPNVTKDFSIVVYSTETHLELTHTKPAG